VQSAVIFGISAALYGEITLKDGRVEQTNFDSYPVLRIDEAPAIEVHIVQSSEPPGGMGEAGTSAVVPAVTNAVFAATGVSLLDLSGPRGGWRSDPTASMSSGVMVSSAGRCFRSRNGGVYARSAIFRGDGA